MTDTSNPNPASSSDRPKQKSRRRPPDWKLPAGVSPGTWDYVHAPSIANDYDQFLAGTELTRFDLMLAEAILPLATKEGAIVADLGCGTGRTRQLAHGKGYRLLGIDLSQPMLQQFLRKGQPDNRDWALRANLVTLDCLADQTVDHAVCLFSSLGMIRGRKNRQTALGHACRILKQGGLFLLHVHNRWAAVRDPGGLRHLMHSWWRSNRDSSFDFGDRVYGYRGLPNMFLHSYGRRELIGDLQHAGFEIVDLMPLTIRGDSELKWGRLATSFRAGGFMVSARRKPRT